MIPIVSDRSSHCKHHVCKKQRENRKCIWQRERSVWEKKSRNKCIEEKREQCVCARVCVYKEWRVLIEKISAPASVSWLQTSTVAPCRNYTPLLPHLGHSAAPPPQPIHLQNRCRSAHAVQMCNPCAVIDRKNLAMATPLGGGIRTAQGVYSDGVTPLFFFKVLMCMSVGEELFRLQAKQLSMVIRELYRGRNQLHHSFLLFMLFILH